MNGLGKLLVFHFLMCLGQTVQGFKIINGETAPENSMQYMVSVQTKYGKHICGGFLITEDFVITAAHCNDEGPYQILLGSHNLKGMNKKMLKIENTCKPSTYQNVGLGDDIMLIKLSEKVPPSNMIQTIPLPTSVINLYQNQICSVAGWGKTLTNRFGVNELRVVNVSIINRELCLEKWNEPFPLNVICAGGYGTTKGFCQGDSGGPLVCNSKAVGVVSFNRNANCNYPDVPNVYTDISRFLPWINKILKENTCQL
ncbi:duodenase-1-like [Nematolebias whitei]|uniref:duodenase-1-like n=1 Tax=Nematolebias whitei TaxID=451745 RepID=UPI00189A06EB|nr:duodenase-1-like [Nematolebias whitei]